MLLRPVGLHNEEMQLQWMLQHIGYKYRVGSNTATRSHLTAEHRGYYFAPDTKTALMGGEADKPYTAWRWRPLPESCQLLAFCRANTRTRERFRPMMEGLFAPRGRDHSSPRWCRRRPWFHL